MLLEPGDAVVMEEAIYPGTLAILRPYNLNYITVESDEDGLRPDKLAKALEK